jgi:hypothetical protein
MLVIIEQTTKDTSTPIPFVTVLLEKQDPPTFQDRPYATHVSPDGGATKFSGHYDMTLDEAVKDYQERIRRGY